MAQDVEGICEYTEQAVADNRPAVLYEKLHSASDLDRFFWSDLRGCQYGSSRSGLGVCALTYLAQNRASVALFRTRQ